MLRILQHQVRDWAKQNFGDVPTWMPLMGAMEELGELSHAHLKEAQGIRLHENHSEKAKDAVGDMSRSWMDWEGGRNDSERAD